MKEISLCSIFIISLSLFANWEIFEGPADDIEFPDEAQTSKTIENGDIYSIVELNCSYFSLKLPSGTNINYYHPLGSRAVLLDVTFSPTYSTLIACSRDSLIHFYEPVNGEAYEYKKSSKEITFEFAVWWVRFSTDGIYIKAMHDKNEATILVNTKRRMQKGQARMKGPNKTIVQNKS